MVRRVRFGGDIFGKKIDEIQIPGDGIEYLHIAPNDRDS